MEQILDRLLQPSMIWVFIPVLCILFWGAASVIRALRGEPGDFEEWKKELKELRARVEHLEQARHGTHLGETTAHQPGPPA
jgi:hypothetical protein